MANDFIRNYPWESLDFSRLTQEEWNQIEHSLVPFFLSHSKAELYQEGVKRDVDIYPVNNIKEILEDRQLEAREFWSQVEHDDLGRSLTYPGGFAKFSNAVLRKPMRAPRPGEHNGQVYQEELGLAADDLVALKQKGVI